MTDGNESDFEPTDESILYAQELVSEHLNRQLGWTTELDQKAASVISVIWIVLALEVSLVVFQQNILTNIVCIPIIIVIYFLFFLQLSCFSLTLLFSYKGHKIKPIPTPDKILLVKEILDGHKFKDKRSAVIQNIADILMASKAILDSLDRKAMDVSRSQQFFPHWWNITSNPA